MYRRESSRKGDPHLWGDEVEYSIVKLVNGTARLALKSQELLSELEDSIDAAWKPENGAYMVEGTPGKF